MALRLPAIELEPIFLGLAEEIIDRLAVLRRDRLVFQEERAAVEIQRDRRIEMIVVLVIVRKNLAVDFVDPAVEPVERFHRRRRVELHAQMPQAAEAGRDVERHVVVRRPAGEPGPCAVAELLVGQFLQQPGRFVVQAVVVEQNADVAARLGSPCSACRSQGVSSIITDLRS